MTMPQPCSVYKKFHLIILLNFFVMTIFNNVKKGFSFYWKDFKLFFQKSSGLAKCKPVLAYPDAGINLSPNPRRYAGLSPNERLNEIKQNLAYVWADGYESKTWKKRQCNYIGIRLTPSLILHEMIGTGRGYDLANAKKLASICKARFLTTEEFREVLYCWDKLSEMRLTAGDFPLEKALMWVYTKDTEQAETGRCILCNPDGEIIRYSEFGGSGNVLLALC